MKRFIEIGKKRIGQGFPVFIVAEIGINHNGSVEIAKKLIDLAVRFECDAVKFQKRVPGLCVPLDQRDKMRETPWGYISYMDYRRKIEFGEEEYREIDRYCGEKGIPWFASAWDVPSLDFLETFEVPCHKVPSACLTDRELLHRLKDTGKPVIVSTGMSSMEEIERAVDVLGRDNIVLMHCTSTYPCPSEELNLMCIKTLRDKFQCVVGYSGHEAGMPPSIVAVALGAVMVERHITLNRTMWGSDQAASLSPSGVEILVRYIRAVEKAMGDGVKKIWPSELEARNRLRN